MANRNDVVPIVEADHSYGRAVQLHLADKMTARAKNRSGYGCDGLSGLDDWLRQRALPAYDAYRADPSRGILLDDIRASLGERAGRSSD